MRTIDVTRHLNNVAFQALGEAAQLSPADAKDWFNNLHPAEKRYFRDHHAKQYLMILEKIVQPQEAANDVRV